MDQSVNQDILARFRRLNNAGHLAHAYLFAGPLGVGKFATAMALVRLVNCLDGVAADDCDCSSCRKISTGNHPDILIMEKPEDKGSIGIEQVRALIERLEFRALEAKIKFALVKDADLLTTEAANAFLKTLEEPRSGTVLILMTALPDALLPTIRSRCQLERFSALSHGALAQLLQRQYHVSSDDAVVLAAFGQGSPGRAMELGEKFIERRARILDAFLSSMDNEAFLKDVVSESASGSTRDSAREVLSIIVMALRDALMIKIAAPELVVNRDRQVELRRFSERYSAGQLQAHADRVCDAFRRVDGNQNVKLVLSVVREGMST